jgi:adenylosuccinate synthase
MVRRDPSIAAAVRVGGTNSGHTGIGKDGRTYALRQLPAAAIDGATQAILPAGSYIDLEVLQAEVDLLGLEPSQVAISPLARIITDEHKAWERAAELGVAIGSTQSGTGGSVLAMAAREAANFTLKSVQAEDVPALEPYLADVEEMMRRLLDDGRRIVIEGTQGFGLSLLHGEVWPKATSRDTTAAGFLSEAGLSPRDVDDVTMVIRCHPIRVAGDSGALPGETTWEAIASEAALPSAPREYTTVTRRLRRVGCFDSRVVRRAILANQPDRIVLNHLDYVDPHISEGRLTAKAAAFVRRVEEQIGRGIDCVGTGPASVIDLSRLGLAAPRSVSSKRPSEMRRRVD